MRPLLPLLLLLLATPSLAVEPASVRPIDVGRASRLSARDLPTTRDRLPEGDRRPTASPLRREEIALGCGSDGVVNAGNTLQLLPGDLAGSIVSMASAPETFKVNGVDLALLVGDQSFPATFELDIFEASGTGFAFVAGFLVDLDVDPTGEILSVDLRDFGVIASGDLLVLAGDVDAGDGLMLPAADDSPRCWDGSNECSVVLPAQSTTFFLYGVEDAESCPRTDSHVLLLDLVMEVRVDEASVPLVPMAFGALKARY